MRPANVVMVDQDGVVCGTDYNTTADVRTLTRLFQETGNLLVPNSDTPALRLQRNFDVFLGFRPDTVIAEGGAVVVSRGVASHPANIRGVVAYRRALAGRFCSRGITVMIGDSATWIREGRLFPPGQRLLIIDGLRKQTVGFYLKATDVNGVPVTDAGWSAEGFRMAEDLPLPRGLLPLDYNPKYGIAISNATGVTKTTGYRVLRERYRQAEFFMIGDSDADIIEDPAVTLCSVGNGSAKLKERAAFVANGTITAGLAECLSWVMER